MNVNKTTQEIVEVAREAIMYYATDPGRRGMDGSACAYLASSGQMCAVGRCLLEPQDVEVEFSGEGVSGIPRLDAKLKPEYRGIGCLYWVDMQEWHDRRENWDEDRLSLEGLQEAMNIVAKAAAGLYTLSK